MKKKCRVVLTMPLLHLFYHTDYHFNLIVSQNNLRPSQGLAKHKGGLLGQKEKKDKKSVFRVSLVN
jgi:hypothetical protein